MSEEKMSLALRSVTRRRRRSPPPGNGPQGGCGREGQWGRGAEVRKGCLGVPGKEPRPTLRAGPLTPGAPGCRRVPCIPAKVVIPTDALGLLNRPKAGPHSWHGGGEVARGFSRVVSAGNQAVAHPRIPSLLPGFRPRPQLRRSGRSSCTFGKGCQAPRCRSPRGPAGPGGPHEPTFLESLDLTLSRPASPLRCPRPQPHLERAL